MQGLAYDFLFLRVFTWNSMNYASLLFRMLIELVVSVLLFLRGLVSIDLGVQVPRTQFLDILLNIFLPELLFS